MNIWSSVFRGVAINFSDLSDVTLFSDNGKLSLGLRLILSIVSSLIVIIFGSNCDYCEVTLKKGLHKVSSDCDLCKVTLKKGLHIVSSESALIVIMSQPIKEDSTSTRKSTRERRPVVRPGIDSLTLPGGEKGTGDIQVRSCLEEEEEGEEVFSMHS